jgi:3-deoxy-D-manno-octulosonic-acid transferase
MNRFIYTLLLYLLLPFVPLKLFWRSLKQPTYRQYWGERVGLYNNTVEKPIIWLHCVSVGETRATEPLIKALQLKHPNHQILLTHTTPTGRDTSIQLFSDSVTRVYLPYDLPFAVNNFISHFKPAIGLIMETELWFNLINACKNHKIPLLLLNARLSEKSAKSYAKLGKLVSNGLQELSAIAAQTEEDLSRFVALGATNVSITGNLKFDVKPPSDAYEKGLQLRHLFGLKRTVFLAASTRDGEEKLILDAVKDLNILTVFVPRHPQRFNEVENIIQNAGFSYERRSNLLAPINHQIQIILGDTMGELYTYYAACDFTFIGGSLLKYGGQNLIEAAVMGKPILIGEHTFNFAEASKNAIRDGAALRVKDTTELRKKIEYLTQNAKMREDMSQASLRFSKAYTGVTERLIDLIEQHMRNH